MCCVQVRSSGGTGGGPYSPCTGGGFAHENALLTYATLLARNFSAELHLQAWSGIGLIHNAHDAAETKYNMSTLWRATLGSRPPDRPDNQWNFSQWVPSVVIANLGINDFGSNGVQNQVRLATMRVR